MQLHQGAAWSHIAWVLGCLGEGEERASRNRFACDSASLQQAGCSLSCVHSSGAQPQKPFLFSLNNKCVTETAQPGGDAQQGTRQIGFRV